MHSLALVFCPASIPICAARWPPFFRLFQLAPTNQLACKRWGRPVGSNVGNCRKLPCAGNFGVDISITVAIRSHFKSATKSGCVLYLPSPYNVASCYQSGAASKAQSLGELFSPWGGSVTLGLLCYRSEACSGRVRKKE